MIFIPLSASARALYVASPTILKVLVFVFLSVPVHVFVFVSEQKWREQSEAAKDEAAKLPHGKLKNQLLREACQLKTASQINLWISSPGLQSPT
jgi:hypothetical protein